MGVCVCVCVSPAGRARFTCFYALSAKNERGGFSVPVFFAPRYYCLKGGTPDDFSNRVVRYRNIARKIGRSPRVIAAAV